MWAAIFNFAALFVFRHFIGEFRIADPVANFVNRQSITLPVILSALIAAIAWNLLTWWFGIPSSSSYTLLGAFVGAALTRGWAVHGREVINYSKVAPTFFFIALAPLIALFAARGSRR